MSIARFGCDGSDVYVYQNTEGGYECCGCIFLSEEIVDLATFKTAAELLGHMDLHRRAGHSVPNYVFQQLADEASK